MPAEGVGFRQRRTVSERARTPPRDACWRCRGDAARRAANGECGRRRAGWRSGAGTWRETSVRGSGRIDRGAMLADAASRPPGPSVPSGPGRWGVRSMAARTYDPPMPLTLDAVRALPKVELHLHVESLSSAASVEALADELGVPLLRPRGELYRCDS